MNYLVLALVVYMTLAIALYVSYNITYHNFHAPPPRRYFRFTMPWYYHLGSRRGNWFFGFWNLRHRKGYPEVGIRILGFEYWVEYWN